MAHISKQGEMMIFRKALLLLVCVATLAGCATPVKPEMEDTANLAPGQGIMVARIAMPYLARNDHLPTTIFVANTFSMNYTLPPDSNNVSAIRERLYSGTPIALHTAETFLVVPLPAGTYSWSGMQIGSYSSYWGAKKKFDIVAGKINYVGDMTLVMGDTGNNQNYRVNLRSYDYHELFLPKIAAAYPKLWGSYPVLVNLTRGSY
jgi:hypothetical protein